MQVTREVKKLPGISDVKVTQRSKEVTVVFDPAQVSADEIRRVIDKANEEMLKEGQVPDPGKSPLSF